MNCLMWEKSTRLSTCSCASLVPEVLMLRRLPRDVSIESWAHI